jgi:hypothetical protein
MAKIDFKKELKHLYNVTSKDITIIDVPAMNFLMIDGTGNPNTSQDYKDALEALFSLSYTLKFMIKKANPDQDYGVMPLEGLWWEEDMSNFSVERKDTWNWTSMIMQPEMVTEALFKEAYQQVKNKKNPAALDKVRFESFQEGPAAQIVHFGPFSAEGPTIEKLHNFIKDNGYIYTGKHHEIYMSDFRKTAPEKLKTIIRQPIKKI